MGEGRLLESARSRPPTDAAVLGEPPALSATPFRPAGGSCGADGSLILAQAAAAAAERAAAQAAAKRAARRARMMAAAQANGRPPV